MDFLYSDISKEYRASRSFSATVELLVACDRRLSPELTADRVMIVVVASDVVNPESEVVHMFRMLA